MTVTSVTKNGVLEAATVLARAMLDEPGGRWLLPDRDEFLEVHERLFIQTMTLAIDEGRVDAAGDPFVGVAVWLERPPLDEMPPVSLPPPSTPPIFPGDAEVRLRECDRLLRLMRRRARPDHHVYLDSIGVLPDHRRRGIATQLLEAGAAWADTRGLPVSLDTLDPSNVSFYRRRGFEIVASEPVVGADLTVTSMRRSPRAQVRRSASAPGPPTRR
jgi:ribosomal protein S18 acetylase RimI-like enzyme